MVIKKKRGAKKPSLLFLLYCKIALMLRDFRRWIFAVFFFVRRNMIIAQREILEVQTHISHETVNICFYNPGQL